MEAEAGEGLGVGEPERGGVGLEKEVEGFRSEHGTLGVGGPWGMGGGQDGETVEENGLRQAGGGAVEDGVGRGGELQGGREGIGWHACLDVTEADVGFGPAAFEDTESVGHFEVELALVAGVGGADGPREVMVEPEDDATGGLEVVDWGRGPVGHGAADGESAAAVDGGAIGFNRGEFLEFAGREDEALAGAGEEQAGELQAAAKGEDSGARVFAESDVEIEVGEGEDSLAGCDATADADGLDIGRAEDRGGEGAGGGAVEAGTGGGDVGNSSFHCRAGAGIWHTRRGMPMRMDKPGPAAPVGRLGKSE